MDGLPLGDAEVVVVVSPHGGAPGVYRAASGSLAALGLPHLGREDPGSGELVGVLGIDVLDEAADYGVLVPLMMLPPGRKTLGVSLPDDHADAAGLAAGLIALAATRSVAVVASAHPGAGLSPRAPLTELPGAHDAQRRLLDAIAADVGELRDRDEGVMAALRSAGACGTGPLTLLGELFAGRRMEVHALEAPVGVGYLVGATT